MNGGRNARSTHDAIFHQQWIFDTTHQKLQEHICIILDAQKCYDRMYPNVGTIEFTRLGHPMKASISITNTVSNTAHHVSTKSGVSKNIIK